MLELLPRISAYLVAAAAIGYTTAWFIARHDRRELESENERLRRTLAERNTSLADSERVCNALTLDLAEANQKLALAPQIMDQPLIVQKSEHTPREWSQATTESTSTDPESLSYRKERTFVKTDSGIEASTNIPKACWPRQIPVKPEKTDALTSVYGIDKESEQLLNRLGVFFIKQIACWDTGDIQFFESKHPKFAGRIARERWVRSAIEVHYTETGEWITDGEPLITMPSGRVRPSITE